MSSIRPRPASGRLRRRTCSMARSEEHTSELQSQSNLVCRLLLEKKKINESRQYSYCVVVVASRHACSSSFVQHEIGGAIFVVHKITTIIWAMPPEELRGCLGQCH